MKAHSRRTNLIRVAVAVATCAVAGSVFAAPAGADDVGDGQNACNIGEICLDRDYGPSEYQRDFFNGGNDTGYWYDTRFIGNVTNQPVHDSSSAIENRDTACNVYVVDYYPGTSTVRRSANFARNSSSWVYVGSNVNDQNDAHWRCNIGGT